MRILLTGATGFVGSSILQNLCQDSNLELEVISKSKKIEESVNSITIHHFYDFEKESLRSVLRQKKFDVLVHAAWQGLPDRCPELNSQNLNITSNLFEEFVNSGGKVIIGLGSCLEYGTRCGQVSESDSGSNLSDFGFAKRFLSSQLSKFGVPYVWIRPFYLYGPGQHPNSLLNLSLKYLSSDDSTWMIEPYLANDFTHVHDLGRLVHTLIKGELWIGELNAGTSLSTRNIEFVNSVRKLVGKSEYSVVSHDDYVGMSADLTKLRRFLPDFSFLNLNDGLNLFMKQKFEARN
jgi:nucleoside-diphosphate-sugar epimerase